jgi:hypothetical protein
MNQMNKKYLFDDRNIRCRKCGHSPMKILEKIERKGNSCCLDRAHRNGWNQYTFKCIKCGIRRRMVVDMITGQIDVDVEIPALEGDKKALKEFPNSC